MLEKFLRGGVNVRGVFVLGGNCPGGICPGVIVRGVIVRGVIVLIPLCAPQNVNRKILSTNICPCQSRQSLKAFVQAQTWKQPKTGNVSAASAFE